MSQKSTSEKKKDNEIEKAKTDRLTPKDYLNKVLAGTATGIVVGLIPNAILGEIFKALRGSYPIFGDLYNIVNVMQFIVPVMVGVLIALQFKFNPMQSIIVGAAAFLGSGAYKVTEAGVQMVGIGDLINVMLVSFLAVYVIRLIGDRLGSLTVLLLPIIVGAGVGAIGLFMLPYVKQITVYIGDLINTFTTLQPLLMAILISVSFSILIISPISTVAIGIAIGVTGLGAGSAAIGVAACTAILVIGSRRVNQSGVTLAVLLGAMKMMMPNLVEHPRLAIPVVANAILGGIGAYMFNILGTPSSAGFGLVGLVGPIASVNAAAGAASAIVSAIVAFIVIPFVGGFIIDIVCRKVLHLYTYEIFKFIQS